MRNVKMNWDMCFKGDEPDQVVRAIKRVYSAYPTSCMPMGICDPMYIMNVIALELGIGDGKGGFTLPPARPAQGGAR